MVELYGPAFTAAYGEHPSPLWLAAIAELTDDECCAGLVRLAKQAREFPANLTQFVAACRPPKQEGVRYLGTPMTDEQKRALALPKPEVPREKIDRYLASMRAKVRS